MSTKELQQITPAGVAVLLQGMGFQGKVIRTEESCYVESYTGGLQFHILCILAGGDQAKGNTDTCEAIRFLGGWDDLPRYDERELADFFNWFQSNKRYAKAYRIWGEDTLQILVEAEWLVRDGITASTFERLANIFSRLYQIAGNALDNIRQVDEDGIVRRHDQAIACIHGPTRNTALAVELYRQNGDAGFAGSQNNLGDLYEQGQGVDQNPAYATYWYTRAAERGEPTAYLSLAQVLSSNSDEVDVLVDAAKFAILAVDCLPNGRNKDAANRIAERLADQLSTQDWSRSYDLAKAFRPLYQEPRLLSDIPAPRQVGLFECASIQ